MSTWPPDWILNKMKAARQIDGEVSDLLELMQPVDPLSNDYREGYDNGYNVGYWDAVKEEEGKRDRMNKIWTVAWCCLFVGVLASVALWAMR